MQFSKIADKKRGEMKTNFSYILKENTVIFMNINETHERWKRHGLPTLDTNLLYTYTSF